MRVLFLITSFERAGSQAQLVELLAGTHPERVDSTVAMLAGRIDAQHARRLGDHGVPRVTLAPARGPRAVRITVAMARLGQLLRRLRPDAVYAWGEYPSLIGWAPAGLHRIPFVVARRNSRSTAVGRPAARAARWVEMKAKLVTANSVAALEAAARSGVPRERLRLVPNGHEPGRAWPAPAGDEVRLGYVAGLRPGKGHRPLLDALSHVRARERWCVQLAGTGPLRDALVAEVRERGLDGRVDFLGLVEDMPRFWRERDACVLLSEAEGSSNALAEAGLAGRPLVASDVPGNRELVTPGSGLLVAPGDARGTARAIEAIIADAALRERLGRGARDRMRAFGIERMIDAHLDALTEAVGRKGA